MANEIVVTRGLKKDAPILKTGQIGFATDTNELLVGNSGVNREFPDRKYIDALMAEKANLSYADFQSLNRGGFTVWDSGNSSFYAQHNGYHKFQNGLTIQWGLVLSEGNTHVTFPIAFNIAWSAQATTASGEITNPSTRSISLTGIDIVTSYAAYVYWLAIGYIG